MGNLDDKEIKSLQEKSLKENLRQRAEGEEKFFDIAFSGTTATLVIQLPKKVIIGWVGDSRVALHKREKSKTENWLTKQEHTPNNRIEQERIYRNKGEIRLNYGDNKNKIYVRGRMYPGLSVTRSLGDLLAH